MTGPVRRRFSPVIVNPGLGLNGAAIWSARVRSRRYRAACNSRLFSIYKRTTVFNVRGGAGVCANEGTAIDNPNIDKRTRFLLTVLLHLEMAHGHKLVELRVFDVKFNVVLAGFRYG